MSMMLLEGPAIEPLTIDELKSYLQITRSEEHLLLSSEITAARVQVERVTQRILIKQRWRIMADCWPVSGALTLDIAPIISFDSVWLRQENGDWSALSSGDFWLDNSRDPGRLLLKRGAARPNVVVPSSGFAVDVSVGYGESPEDIPGPLKEAVLRQAAAWFEKRSGEQSTGKATSIIDMPFIQPFVRLRL